MHYIVVVCNKVVWLGFSIVSATARVISRFGLLGLNASVSARVISRFGLLGLNASVSARVIRYLGLVCWGLTPQYQPG